MDMNAPQESLVPQTHPSPDPAHRPDSDLALGQHDRNPPGISFLDLLREDYETHNRNPFSQGFWALAVHRFGNRRMSVKSRLLRLPMSLLYKVLAKWVQWICGIELAYTVKVGRRVRIWHHGGMVLGALEIGDEVEIRQNVTFGVRKNGDGRWMKPVIGRRAQIGAGAVIVGPVVVGENSTVGANVVLAQDVPPNSLVTAPKPIIRPLR
jgi:serine O-acetyltransferase